jgi:3-oxoacyl-[acyl-carrier protein] reductase
LQDEVLTAGELAGPLYLKIRELRASGKGGVSPDVPAKLITFLASDASGALTGKLISAPHDPWAGWGEQAEKLNATPLYAIRRIDPYTVRPLLADLT